MCNERKHAHCQKQDITLILILSVLGLKILRKTQWCRINEISKMHFSGLYLFRQKHCCSSWQIMTGKKTPWYFVKWNLIVKRSHKTKKASMQIFIYLLASCLHTFLLKYYLKHVMNVYIQQSPIQKGSSRQIFKNIVQANN